MKSYSIHKTSSMPQLPTQLRESADLEIKHEVTVPDRGADIIASKFITDKKMNKQQRENKVGRRRNINYGLGKRNASIDEGLRDRDKTKKSSLTRNVSDANVGGNFRTCDKEDSRLPYLSQPAIGPDSKHRAGDSTRADTSLNVDKSQSIEFKMPQTALPKSLFLKEDLQESREELASISSMQLDRESTEMPILNTIEQTVNRDIYSSSK